MRMTTKDDDDGVVTVLKSIISQSYPKGTIGYDYLSNAISHIRKMRKEIAALSRS